MINSYSLLNEFRLKIEGLFLFVLVLLIFSYDFHGLWLIYDFLAIYSLFKVIKTNLVVPKFLILSVTFFFCLYSIYINGFYFISILSVWDNIKHIFILQYFYLVVNRLSLVRLVGYSEYVYRVLTAVFFVQLLVVMAQYALGFHFDDISGTFGSGASHSLGYFTILYLSAILFIRKVSLAYFMIVFLLSIFMNYIAENVGIYLLMAFLIAYARPIYLLYGLVLFFGMMLVFEDLYHFVNYVLINRVFSFFSYPDITSFDISNVVSRSTMMMYSLFLGGFIGGGIGAFSEIYGVVGWRYDDLLNHQVTISSFTTLLAEYGIIGMLLMYILYISNLYKFFLFKKDVVFTCVFFTLAFLYNRVLNDERIIFQIIFIIIFIKIYEKNKVAVI